MQGTHLAKRPQILHHALGRFRRHRQQHMRAHQPLLVVGRQPHAVANDDAARLEPFDAALHGRARNTQPSGEFGGRRARVFTQQCDEVPVGLA